MPKEDLDATLPAPAPSGALLSERPLPQSEGTLVAGRYELLGLIGSGGMGTVYRARDRELGELVALKVLRHELLRSADMLTRFRSEVALAHKVTHPNVARTFDIGEHAGDRFLTMELIEGESLGALLQRTGRLEIPVALDIATEACRGLEAAHRAGVIHLDLKPDNILLARDGRIVLSDFGIARAMGADGSEKTSPAGTPAYMAPEQVKGAPLDPAADIYALGAIVYEALTGEPAWTGPTALAVAVARLFRAPPDPRVLRPDVPDALAEVVLRCMATEPADRFPSAADVRAALEATSLRPSAKLRLHSSTPLRSTARTVAVLSFANRGAPSDDYLADGLTEETIDALGSSPTLRVRAREAVMPFKNTERDPCALGRLLGVDVVVAGTVLRVNEAVRVTVRVMGVEDGYHLWTRRVEVREGELLGVADEVAAAVARVLGAPRDAREVAARDDAGVAAFLRARHELNKGSPEHTRVAIALLEDALSRLPDDPTVLAAYAQAQFRRFTYDIDDPSADEAAELCERAARQALAVSPLLIDARVALANLRLSVGDGPGAARELIEALRSGGGGSALAQDLYGRLLAEVSTAEEALDHLRRAVAIEPTLERARADLLRLEAMLGKWNPVSDVLEPGCVVGSVFWFLCARVALWSPAPALAVDLQARIRDIDFRQRPMTVRLLRLRLGEISADEVATELRPLLRKRGASIRRPLFARQLLTEVWLSQGRVEDAVAEILAATELGLMDTIWLTKCPLLAPLAAEPRLEAPRREVAARARAVLDILRSTGSV